MVTENLLDKVSRIAYNACEDYSKMLGILRIVYPSLTSAQQRVAEYAPGTSRKPLWLTSRRKIKYTCHLISPKNLAKIKELEHMIISGALGTIDVM